jgi:YHS domain-containing protein
MKKAAFILASTFLLAACNASVSVNNDGAADSSKGITVTTTTDSEPVAEGPKDPVCDMVKDSTWTEYTIHENDTVWFCSGTCKQAFEGNKAKYAPKLKS